MEGDEESRLYEFEESESFIEGDFEIIPEETKQKQIEDENQLAQSIIESQAKALLTGGRRNSSYGQKYKTEIDDEFLDDDTDPPPNLQAKKKTACF